MIINYADGRQNEAVQLFRTDHTMRVALKGYDDAMDLIQVNGAWFSENSEAIEVVLARRAGVPSVADCICSPELASRLIDLLFAGSYEAESAAPPRYLSAGSVGM